MTNTVKMNLYFFHCVDLRLFFLELFLHNKCDPQKCFNNKKMGLKLQNWRTTFSTDMYFIHPSKTHQPPKRPWPVPSGSWLGGAAHGSVRLFPGPADATRWVWTRPLQPSASCTRTHPRRACSQRGAGGVTHEQSPILQQLQQSSPCCVQVQRIHISAV